jgi:hypothetical protein
MSDRDAGPDRIAAAIFLLPDGDSLPAEYRNA